MADTEEQECCLNPKDFITFKTEIDLLCDDEVDVFRRWGILEDIQKTKVGSSYNVSLYLLFRMCPVAHQLSRIIISIRYTCCAKMNLSAAGV